MSNMQSPSTSTSTPRTSRRLTTSTLQTPSRPPIPPQFPTLSQLNLRPYPSASYAVDSTLQSKLLEDRSALDYAITCTSEALSSKKRDVQACLTEIDQEKRRLEALTKGLGEQARESIERSRREQEEMREQKGKRLDVDGQGRTLDGQVENVQAEIKEEMKKLQARRDIKARQKEQYLHQLGKNTPELNFFEDKLGLKIRGIGSNLIQFKYTNIDSRNHQRQFGYTLDASKPKYSVALTHPSPSYLPPSILTPLLADLNATRDLYAFLRLMRNAFMEEVRLEKMGLGASGEEEKEKERARGRAG